MSKIEQSAVELLLMI